MRAGLLLLLSAALSLSDSICTPLLLSSDRAQLQEPAQLYNGERATVGRGSAAVLLLLQPAWGYSHPEI